MKIAYTAPSKDELYLIDRKSASHIVRSLCPEVPLVAFQTMHVPKMSEDILYLATFAPAYIRFLSVRPEHITSDLRVQFPIHVLPHICESVNRRRDASYLWPAVVVAFDRTIYVAECSGGCMMPNRNEILRDIKKHRRVVCSYETKEAYKTRHSNHH
jgi:hypothetical protein